MAYRVDIRVMPRATLLDPQGEAVHHALTALAFQGVRDVRVGKHVTFVLDAPDDATARRTAETMCERLLANPVTEDYWVQVEPQT